MPTPEPRKILVVDDEPEICWIVKKVLVENGFEVELAFDGARGLEAMDRAQPCLVMLDIKMPGMDGFETLERIRTRFSRLPVVILSASDDQGGAVRAMKLGAYDYLSKPLNLDEMLITLKNALRTSELLSEVDHLKHQIAACRQRAARETIRRVLADTRGNKARTAKRLKIDPKTLCNKMKALGI
jgi:DNA-binding NtrC family response regulator